MDHEGDDSPNLGEPLPNDIEISWTRFACLNALPVDGHCSCACNNKLYTFGGVMHLGQEYYKEMNQLAVFHPDSKKYEILTLSGDVPSTRSSAAMVSIDNKLYLFGGLSCESGWFNDLHVFDTDTGVWKKIETTGLKPSPRDKVACVVIENQIYIFGGFGPLSESQVENRLDNEEAEREDEGGNGDDLGDGQAANFGWFDDLYVFDTSTNIWSQPVQSNKNGPSARAACSMCLVSSNLIIFGGRDKHGRCSDLHIFDTASNKWTTEMSLSGQYPEPRAFHAAVAVGNRMLICGGRSIDDDHFSDGHIFDYESLQWLQPKVLEGYVGRGCHTATLVGDQVVMFGGSANFNKETSECQKLFNDFYLIPAAQVMKGGIIPSHDDKLCSTVDFLSD